MVWAFTTADALATYLAAHDKPLAASLCPHPSASSVAFQHASRALLAGAVAAALGNLLRQWCYRELGALFTFELTIAPRHRLVTTGPYAVVRHPSYVGVFLTLLGASAVVLARGSWVRACWSGAPPGGATAAQAVVWVLVAFWCAKVAFAVVNVVRRLDLEERELRRKLGEKWEAYARRVRWKLLPLMC
ncbi:isoprenylcysteine carboxylmethyltransferase family protein [Phanerochaete sordida]|uniref:Protein-S-isoprenylcysteine O-methyltransferase n=1 Tax=Phanerochaete sordida TaxID=48140 RepID=A0A9P3GRH6_9APHY|nr:isoprenylcysteine carboxylmethyltransferase family protein [Phanerochaete sordida]